MKDIEKSKGKMVMIYGATGVGKSTTCLESLPEPILNIFTEDRNPYTSIEALEREPDFDPISPENNQDLIDFLYKMLDEYEKGTCKYKSIMFDSLSFWMNIKLYGEMVDETHDAGIFKKSLRPLVDDVRADEALYGGLAERMQRLIRPLKMMAQKGMIVVVVAYLSENPKWDRTLAAAPNFAGKAWNLNYEQHFDVIGLIRHRLKEDDKGNTIIPQEIIYPPIIQVKSPDDSFICKWTGRNIKGNSYPLNFKKMFGIKDEEEKEKAEEHEEPPTLENPGGG